MKTPRSSRSTGASAPRTVATEPKPTVDKAGGENRPRKVDGAAGRRREELSQLLDRIHRNLDETEALLTD